MVFDYEEIGLTRATIPFLSELYLESFAFVEWRFELVGDYCSIGYGYHTIFPTAITKLLILTRDYSQLLLVLF